MFSLELPHGGDSNENTHYTIISIKRKFTLNYLKSTAMGCFPRDSIVVVIALLFYVHGKHLRSCRDGQLT